MLNFQLINKDDPEKLMYFYNKAYSWDKDKICFTEKKEKLADIIKYDNYIMQKGNSLIGFASNNSIENNIETYITVRDKFTPKEETPLKEIAEVCTIIRPDYRGFGYGSKLLESLLEVTKLKYSSAIAYIILGNKASLSLYKSFDFKYRCTNNGENYYEKKLIMK